jgi:gluconolactonase
MSRSTPRIEILDPEMKTIVDPAAPFTAVASGLKFTEGPAWLPRTREWVFSDIPGDTIYAWSRVGGLRVFRTPSHRANGNTTDREGRLITCEHGARRVTRTEPDGSVTVLAAHHAGRRLNSPNDAVVKSDGTLWFTDPPYGIKPDEKEQPGNHVYRLDPGAAEPVAVATDFLMPNGLCFSPDESRLYVADSSSERHHVRRLRVTRSNALEDDGVFAAVAPHVPDGIRMDAAGRLYSTAGDGVQAFRPDGTLIGKFLTPQVAANCCLGGPAGNELLITATTSVWLVALR